MSNPSVAIVSGASQGIGRSTAIRLARDFGRIVAVARTREHLEETAALVEKAGAEALVIATDLGLAAAPDEVVGRTLEAFGRIDAVLNIAGAVPQIDLFEMTDEQWHAGMELKLHGARRLALKAWPALMESAGAVVFTSGNSAQFPKSPYAAVGTVNAAVAALAKAFAERGLKDGVQVNSVLPGPVMTGRRAGYLASWATRHRLSADQAASTFLEQAGIRRYGKPEEIAELMAFLVSPATRWLTGAAIRMDGGEAPLV